MNLRIMPKAQQIIADRGNAVTVGLDKQICYS